MPHCARVDERQFVARVTMLLSWIMTSLPLPARCTSPAARRWSAGETDRSLLAAVRAGTLVRLRHGAYAPTVQIAELDERRRHLVLARAALAQQRGGAALAGPSAALLRGYDPFGHDLNVVHLARLDHGSSRRQAGVVHHVVQEEVKQRIQPYDGVPAVSPADAVWQVALLSTLEGAVVTADSALHLRPGLAHELQRLAARTVHQPRSRVARLAMRLARSVGESLTRIACFRNGIPSPDLQHDVHDDSGRLLGRTDFWWEGFRHLGEFDGKIKYGRLLKEGETPSDAVVREKRREDARRGTRCGMSRFAWFEIQPGSTGRRMAQLVRELEQSRRLYVPVGSRA